MPELFAADYPRRCGMDPWLDVARGVGFVSLAAILVVVWFRYHDQDDPPG